MHSAVGDNGYEREDKDMDIELVSLRRINDTLSGDKPNKLIGFMIIRIDGITIRDCRAMYNKEDKRYWIAMPSKSYGEGSKKVYYNIVQIGKEISTEVNEELSKQIKEWLELDDSKKDDDVPF